VKKEEPSETSKKRDDRRDESRRWFQGASNPKTWNPGDKSRQQVRTHMFLGYGDNGV